MKNFKILSLFVAVLLLAFNSCKKEEDDPIIPEISTPGEQGSNDETARTEYDNAIDDIFSALENTGISTGRSASGSGVILPCGVVRIDSTGGTYKFVYDSTTNCQKRVLSGSITASLISGTMWSDSGAQMTLTFTNYKVLFTVNNQTLTFNGVLTITNVNGGKVWMVLSPTNKTIVHKISGNLNITFDNNSNDTRAWAITKKRTYQSTDGTFAGVTWMLEADGTNAEVGTAKDGTPFITTIPTPIKWINCSPTGTFEGPYKAIEGELKYTNQSNFMKAEAGYTYDVSSKTESFAGDCTSEGYKLTFFINGKTQTSFQYY